MSKRSIVPASADEEIEAPGQPTRQTRRREPDRRGRLIEVALDVIVEHGLAGLTHRKVAAAAGVPLGSMTQHFTGIEELAHQAFAYHVKRVAADFEKVFRDATDAEDAREALVAIAFSDSVGSSRSLRIVHELYAYADRNPDLHLMVANWIEEVRATLETHFAPLTARALNALLEGVTMHNALGVGRFSKADVRQMVGKVIELNG